MSMKNSSDTIGIQIRDLPTCSAVPQPTAPPRASSFIINGFKLHTLQRNFWVPTDRIQTSHSPHRIVPIAHSQANNRMSNNP